MRTALAISCMGFVACAVQEAPSERYIGASDFLSRSEAEQEEILRGINARTRHTLECSIRGGTDTSYRVRFEGKEGVCPEATALRTITYIGREPYWACMSPLTRELRDSNYAGTYEMDCGEGESSLQGPFGRNANTWLADVGAMYASYLFCGAGLLLGDDRYTPASRGCESLPRSRTFVAYGDRRAVALSRMYDANTCGHWLLTGGDTYEDDRARAEAWREVGEYCAAVAIDCEAAQNAEGEILSSASNLCVTPR